MGDSANIPWRLLDISFQVEDHETGSESSLRMSFVHCPVLNCVEDPLRHSSADRPVCFLQSNVLDDLKT